MSHLYALLREFYVDPLHLTVFFLVFIMLAAFGIQLFLCFRAKALWLRFSLPVLFLGLFVLFIVLGMAHSDFERLAYFILSVLTLAPMAGCGAGWGIWYLIQYQHKS